jgi:glucose-1-phosphate cytidylyltransferase
MKAVILGDRYSKETIKQIINYYVSFGINEFILCYSSKNELIEEKEQNNIKIIIAYVGKAKTTTEQLLKIRSLITYGRFFLTYGDYFCRADLINLIEFHKNHGGIVSLVVAKHKKRYFSGGFMIIDSDIYEYIPNEKFNFEKDVMTRVGEDMELSMYIFSGEIIKIHKNKNLYSSIT